MSSQRVHKGFKQRKPPFDRQLSVCWFTFQFSLFLLSGSLSQLITSTPSNTTIRAKSPTSNPASFSHTPVKEIEGKFRWLVERGAFKHLILRVFTSSFCFLGVTSTVLITFNIIEWGRRLKKTVPPFPLINTQKAGSTLMHPHGGTEPNIKSMDIKKAHRIIRQDSHLLSMLITPNIQLYLTKTMK